MQLSDRAIMLLRRMQSEEGHWISASEGRTNNAAVNELMDGVYATYGQLHSRDGIVLTIKGRNAKLPPPPKPPAEKKKRSTKSRSTKKAEKPSTKPAVAVAVPQPPKAEEPQHQIEENDPQRPA